MPYVAPYIDSTGLHIPTYDDILADLVAQMKNIYGQDIYLGNDSADYQLLSIFALKIYDCNLALQSVYNNTSPQSAIGTALDSLVKLNGISRKAASYSTCQVKLTGTAGTVINYGVVKDSSGNKWDLPAVVTIMEADITVSATSQKIGAITATVGSIVKIETPTAGWTAVTNEVAAVAGQPVETDSELRIRQSLSTSLPSNTLLAGTIAAIASTANVSRYQVYENQTDSVDANGLPRHSITAVVEGGSDADIAQAIYDNRGIGCMTNGTTTVNITDAVTGNVTPIKFTRPTGVPIHNILDIHPLVGYTSAIETLIIQAVTDYQNSLQIGEDLTVSAVYAAAMTATDMKKPTYSVKAVKVGTAPTPTLSNDIVIAFDSVATSEIAHVIVNQV